MLVAALVLLVLSLGLPWWSETLTASGPSAATSSQSYSPISGVAGTCSPACSSLAGNPPLSPFQGTKSFGSVGLNETGALYAGILGVVIIGIASVVIALVASFVGPIRSRLRASAVLAAIVASVLACGLLASLQPLTYRTDHLAWLSDHGAWTVAPSPETSFWGSCAPGPSSGICASGWSVSWGPGPGWYLIAAAALVLMAIVLVPVLRARRSRSSAGSTEKKDDAVDTTDVSAGNAR